MKNISVLKCSISDCNNLKYKSGSHGYCQAHYYRYWRYGDPLFSPLGKKWGEQHINCDGYRLIYINGKEYKEHRYVMEQHIGRKLLSTEIVHHIDGNKLNNSIDNLKIVNSVSKHLSKYKYNNIRCLFCKRKASSRQMCMKHYQQWRNGKIEKDIPLVHHGTDF